ncbi:MAG: hypothetical protein RMJ28_07010 [Nitrososphaerota archaeon]|nr:hypothetical protein [Candidatus Calditenuaceae archaeon]MDW8073963.1 hypothetical protein [Nitrososphaerota archaeon]
MKFEGVVYEVERRHEAGDVGRVEALAYSELILYERSIVYRVYPTGTRAGRIIKDLASLVPDVNTSNVDEDGTPALNTVWTIQNVEALRVMLDIARGTNHYIRMKPGRRLYFKPKATGTYKAVINTSNTASASLREDRWRLRNRIIYIGADGRVLADVSEPPGDLPLTVHDPFLTDETEAKRRAQTRLALCREYGRQLEVELHRNVFEQMNVELYDTIRVSLPSLGLNNTDLPITGIEYIPESLRYRLTLSGALELLEDYLREAVGGDVAARFGRAMTVPEMLSTAVMTTGEGLRTQSTTRHPIYINKPPLTLRNAQNIVLNSDGHAVLTSGATLGSFEAEVLPGSPLFTSYTRCEWILTKNQGWARVQVLTASGEEIASVIDAAETQIVDIPRWPRAFGGLTFKTAALWGATGASVSDIAAGLINTYCLRLSPTTPGTYGETHYPSAKNLNLRLNFARYLRLYLYGDHAQSFTVKVRLHQDANNYLEGAFNVRRDTWMKYEAALSTFTKAGNPTAMNWISILSPYRLLIDSDYVLTPLLRELLRLKITLGRDSAAMLSPAVRLVKIIWREGDYG